MIRRLLGVLVVASMSHLVVAGSDLVCTTHGGHAATHESQAPMPGMHHHGDAGDTSKEACKVPVRSDCCEAMTTCATNVALTSVGDDHASPKDDAGIAVFVADAPLSRLVPPEPPPPKA
jgi:hypothetical protein